VTIRNIVLVSTLLAAAVSPAASQASANKPVIPASPAASVPALVPFSGIALSGEGRPLSGQASVTFLIFREEQGGDPLWAETQLVALGPAGHYKVQLGASTASGLPLEQFASGDARWLEVQVAGQKPEPRIMLISVPYALKAADAATLGGLPASAFALAGSSAPSPPAAIPPDVHPDTSTDVTTTGGTVGFLPYFNGNTTIYNSLVSQTTGTVFSQNVGEVNIGAATPTALMVDGPFLSPPVTTATQTGGSASQSQNLVASSFSSTSKAAENQTFQWQAEPAGNNSKTPSGTLNLLFASGAAIPAETGFHFNGDGTVNFVAGQKFSGVAGTGTVTSVGSGAGLTGGPITSTGTLSIASGGVTNAMLKNPSLRVAVTPGSGLTGGGLVPLGGSSEALSIDGNVVPLLNATNTFSNTNTFTQPQAFDGGLSAQSPTAQYVVYGFQNAPASPNVAGGYFQSNSPQGTGVVGVNTAGGNAGWFQGPVLVQSGSATSSTSAVSSPPLSLTASIWSTSADAVVSPVFEWQAVATPAATSAANPTTTLNLLYGAGTYGVPPKTVLSINPNGTLNFASGQKFPVTGTGGGTITGVTTTSPLTGSGTTGSVALGLNTTALETTLNGTYAQLGVANTFNASQTFVGNTQTIIGGLDVEGGTAGTGPVAKVYTGLVSAVSLTATNSAAGTNAVYGANTASSGSSNGGYFSSASPGGSAVVGVNKTATGNAGYFQGNVTVTGTLTANGAFQGAGFSASSATANDSVVQGRNKAGKGTSNGGYFSSASPEGSGIVAENSVGGLAGFFQGAVTIAGPPQGAALSASSATPEGSVIQGTSTAGTGASNGGSFSTNSPAGSGIVAANTAKNGNAAWLQGNVVTTGNTATAQLGVGGDAPMSHNPHMVFSGFIPSFASQISIFKGSIGGYFVPDQNIVITRITVSQGNTAIDCSSPAAINLGNVNESVTLASLALGDTFFGQSGPLDLPVKANEEILIYGTPASGGTFCQSPGGVFINVQYVMQ